MCVTFDTVQVSRTTGAVEPNKAALINYLKRWFLIDFLSTVPMDRT